MPISLLPDDRHDRVLRAQVKPSGWVNPTPLPRYQLVVIGGGPAGLVCAAAAAGLGASVALVERDLLGGDCLNVGCVPSKTLLRAARLATEARRANELGARLSEPPVDFAAAMDRVRRVRAELSRHDSADRFRSLGVHVLQGEGRFIGRDAISVSGAVLKFGRCIVATGTRPAVPPIPGLQESRWFTNESIFTLTALPRTLLVIGGGPVGCELAQAFARLGSRVRLATRSGRILPRDDGDAATRVQAALRADGVEFATESGDPQQYDAVLVAAGRFPNVDCLNLEAAGVGFDPQAGIRVDDFLRTSHPRIFAAGDVAATGYRFTHAADATARLAIRNALFPIKGRLSGLTIPWCTYTDPELGHVGLTEAEARRRGIAVTVLCHDAPLDRAATDGDSGSIKIVLQANTDRMLGATVVGPHAGEVIGTLSVAMTAGIGLGKLAQTVFPYPTYTEAIKKVADQYSRSRLTPRAKRLLGTWLRWFR
jgi:pyruvate/2-oxoglutarate dehydrogenase complex dihydrolipoamide dehydrogenase (E3) component